MQVRCVSLLLEPSLLWQKISTSIEVRLVVAMEVDRRKSMVLVGVRIAIKLMLKSAS